MKRKQKMAFYTVGDLARRYDVDPDTIRRWTRNGRLHAVRIGKMGQRIFEANEVERFETRNQRSAQRFRPPL